MQGLVMPTPPNMDAFAPEVCLCGKKTDRSHDFWFCSTECARQDSLRSLDVPECHYRNGMHNAYIKAGVPELYPRRMMSVDHLRTDPSQQRRFSKAFPRSPPMNPSHQMNGTTSRRGAWDQNQTGFPTLSQVTGVVLTNKAKVGEPSIATKQDRPRREGFPNAQSDARSAKRPEDYAFQQIAPDAIPLPEPGPSRTLKRVPTATHGLRNNMRTSLASLLKVGKPRKVKNTIEQPERIFGHPINVILPPARKESLPSHRQKNNSSTVPDQRSKALRRSASFAGWDVTPHGGRSVEEDPVMRALEEMRGEMAESFDPRSLFDMEEAY